MTDRVDIDALLIGALYGELTHAEEARLSAHLESHPADRTALADLTQTRAAVRESRILSVQFEPPQSVSALLLQEAARRAPKPPRESAGWFQWFTRSFLMHPAMAAAAMLVLVVGVAGTIYVRRGDPFETAPPAAIAEQVRAKEYAEQPKPAAVPAPEASGPGRAHVRADVADSKNTGAAGGFGSTAGSDAYRVGLAEPAPQPAPTMPAVQSEQQASAGRAKAATKAATIDSEGNGEGNEAKETTRGQAQDRSLDQPAKPAAPKPAKLAKKGNASLGIELRSAEMAPKDFDDGMVRKAVRKAEAENKQDLAKRDLRNADTRGDRVSTIASDQRAQAPGAAPAGGGATAVPSMMPQQNPAAAPGPAADPTVVIAGSTRNATSGPSTGSAKSKTPAKPASRSSLAQGLSPSKPPPAAAAEPQNLRRDDRRLADKTTATPPVTPPATSIDAKLAEDKTADDKTLIDWLQKQREQVLAFVKSNNCRAAASAAVAIYNRAPDFYAANIATDRLIKPCIAYVNNEREREDRSRAASKRANSADTPAQAAPPPARK